MSQPEEPVKVDAPCPQCGERDCYSWPSSLWCNTCCTTVGMPSVWDSVGLTTTTVEAFAEQVRAPKPIDLVTWHGPVELWEWPFTPEQRLKLSYVPCMVDGGIIQVYAVGPIHPDLMQEFLPGWEQIFDGSEPGDVWAFRFGQMRLEDLDRLPEHTGW